LRNVAASFTETVKAASPFFTVAVAFALVGERTPRGQVLALFPVVGGLMLASALELSFTLLGFSAALSTLCVECVQNVVCKRLLHPRPLDNKGQAPCTPAQLQYYSAAASLGVQLPLFAGALWRGALAPPGDASVLWLLGLNGLIYYTQSVLAFEVMFHCSPVTVSVLNTAKRALIICLTAAFFGNSITPMARLGTAVTLAGSCLFSVLRVSPGVSNDSEKEQLQRFQTQSVHASTGSPWSSRLKFLCRGVRSNPRTSQPELCRRRRRGRGLPATAALLIALWPVLLFSGQVVGPPAPLRRPAHHRDAVSPRLPPAAAVSRGPGR